MKKNIKKYLTLSLLSGIIFTTGCSGIDTSTAVGLGVSAIGVMSISDDDMIKMSNDACIQSDRTSKIYPENAPETIRVKKIAQRLDSNLLGQPLNFKVYQAEQFNAFAMPNGCIRVQSGNISQFTDDELAAVIGHEMGHVALKHSKNQFKTLNMLYLALQAGGASGTASIFSSPQFQGMVLGLTNGQHSQKHEFEADAYGIDMLKRNNINPNAMVSMLNKLLKTEDGRGTKGINGYFASHPDTQARINAAQAIISGKPVKQNTNKVNKTNSSNKSGYNQRIK